MVFEIINHRGGGGGGDPDDSLTPIFFKRTGTNEWFCDSEVLKILETTQWFVWGKKIETTQHRRWMDGWIFNHGIPFSVVAYFGPDLDKV